MSLWETAAITAAYQEHCQDRVVVVRFPDRLVLAVADGAGGSGAGAIAATEVIQEVSRRAADLSGPSAWEMLLAQLDQQISDGETTAVVVEVQREQICGASVGDSQAWIVSGEEITDLTGWQIRKPLLGSRDAKPIAFTSSAWHGTLVIATDGFCNYVKRDKLPAQIARAWFPTLPKELLESVRLPSGALWDDVGIIVCRNQQRPASRVKRYVID